MISTLARTISRPKLGFALALLMLILPGLITASVQSSQRRAAKATPTPKKKKATPTPKKSQARTRATPKPTPKPRTASKTTAKSKPDPKAKTTSSKSNTKSNSKTGKTTTATKNSKTPAKSTTSTSKSTKKPADTRSRTSTQSKSSTSKTATKTPAKTPAKTTSSNTKTKDGSNPAPTTTSKTTPGKPQVIVTGYGIPVRSQARSDASTLTRARLGTVMTVVEKNPAWYKVSYSSGGKTSSGWVSANAVNDLNSSDRTQIYHQIVERNYSAQMDFGAASELADFLTRIDGELDQSEKSAEVRLKRLQAIRAALRSVPADKTTATPYKEFLKAHDDEIVYNEPAGQWLVTANQFWALHEKFKSSNLAENIAWEAANNPLPGECEGYVNCYLFDMRMRFGEYLNRHPSGRNSAEALRNITDYLSPIVADSSQKSIYNGPTDVTDRAEFNNLIAELRTIIARMGLVDKEKALQQLRTIAEAYR